MVSILGATAARETSSFRDPSGFLFWQDGKIFRWVSSGYKAQFLAAQACGLFDDCVRAGLLLPFSITQQPSGGDGFAVLEPQQLSFISYPYEWCFDQLKDAALVTLDLQLKALEKGLLLKDASAYNIQFVDGRPLLIDHLSFDSVADYGLWPAYGQFCRHFLAPLALISYVDAGAARLLQLYIDGVPLELASSLLPKRTRFKLGLAAHIHMHARFTKKYGGSQVSAKTKTLSAEQLITLTQAIRSSVDGLRPPIHVSEWGDYYSATNYTNQAIEAKLALVRELVARVAPATVWDIGGNDGRFSRRILDLASRIVCLDSDPNAVAANYRACKTDGVKTLTPLVVDICNPSPGIGFANKERLPLLARGRPDLVLALALVHHLAISNNVPLVDIARLLSNLTSRVIIEFVPKEDSQVQRLLANRRDIFDAYTESSFVASFETYFECIQRSPIPETNRCLYLFASPSRE